MSTGHHGGRHDTHDLSHESYRDRSLSLAEGLLSDRVVMISGGASGVGKAAAWQAARLGARVAICGRREARLAEVSGAIRDAGLTCSHASVDIRDREAVDCFVADVEESHGMIDLLINSAGGQYAQNAQDLTGKGWRSVVDTNLHGTVNMMQSVARRWLAVDREGSIVTVTFSARGQFQMAHSLAARMGVTGFSEAVAVEWAPGIRVNCIAPNVIASDHFTDAESRLYAQSNPMLRTGNPWDVAAACLFIGGPTAPFITGQTLHINGGSNLWGEVWPLGKPARLRMASAVWETDSAEGDVAAIASRFDR